MGSKTKRSHRSTTNKRRRIHLALQSIMKALILKKLKKPTMPKRKMSMQ